MDDTSHPNITSADERHHDADRRALPTREALQRARLLRKGGKTKADLLLIDRPGGPAIVKDFSRKTWWVRQTGSLLIRRELRAYRRLAGCDGVAALIGRVDRYALALDYLDATQLAFSAQRRVDGSGKLEQLRRIVAALHARGVAHCDLRSRDNVLVDGAGRLFVVDFAAAVCLRPGGTVHRLLFRWFASIDRSACLKWKAILEAGPLSSEERAFAERFRVWRALWFHRRQAWRGKTRPPA